ncbi:hypothetical protein [Arthrobacter castelli]|uniref:hypothetical protein n=1 Tax=Arthrobacter castelli TaxID=271431 RepID=UPI0003FF4C45|nr:hypothetical protein [Arthrobacter castelli]
MRLKIAATLVILGLLAMGAGVGQRTFWAPEETVTASVAGDVEDAPLTVLDHSLNDADGEVQVTVKGEGELMLAVGRADDVEAWVGDAAHVEVVEREGRQLVAERADGAMNVPDPRGSDMWQSVKTGEGEINYTWADPAPGQWAILLATDGTKPAPTTVSVTVPNTAATPWAIPLIVIGALLTVLGLALLFGPTRGNRRGRSVEPAPGTRAARRQSERRGGRAKLGAMRRSLQAGTAGVLALLLAGGVSGAAVATDGPTGPGSASDSGETAGAPTRPGGYPVLLEGQLQQIVESVAGTVKEADAGKDARQLRQRVAGPALELRATAYKIGEKKSADGAPAPISGGPIMASVITSSFEWPRTVVAVTQSEASEVPQAMVLVQDKPRRNYKLRSIVAMLPGTTFPQVSDDPSNVKTLRPDQAGPLVTSPEAALDGLADVLTEKKSKFASRLAKNTFVEQITAFQKEQIKANKSADITFSHTVVEDNTRALRTADGGALVFGYLSNSMVSKPAEDGGTVKLDENYAALAGGDSSSKGVSITFGESIMLYVPPAGSDERVQVIGAAENLVDAKLMK